MNDTKARNIKIAFACIVALAAVVIAYIQFSGPSERDNEAAIKASAASPGNQAATSGSDKSGYVRKEGEPGPGEEPQPTGGPQLAPGAR